MADIQVSAPDLRATTSARNPGESQHHLEVHLDEVIEEHCRQVSAHMIH